MVSKPRTEGRKAIFLLTEVFCHRAKVGVSCLQRGNRGASGRVSSKVERQRVWVVDWLCTIRRADSCRHPGIHSPPTGTSACDAVISQYRVVDGRRRVKA